MKKLFLFPALALCLLSASAQHVILVTIDGFRPDYYMDTTWHAYHLQRLLQVGVHAEGVNSVFPSITYPSHTTIVTGVQPVTHRVYYNDMFDPTTKGRIYWNDSAIHSPTLWAAVTAGGLFEDAATKGACFGHCVRPGSDAIGGIVEKTDMRGGEPVGSHGQR